MYNNKFFYHNHYAGLTMFTNSQHYMIFKCEHYNRFLFLFKERHSNLQRYASKHNETYISSIFSCGLSGYCVLPRQDLIDHM